MNQTIKRLCITLGILLCMILISACTNDSQWESIDDNQISSKERVPFTTCEEDFTFQDTDGIDLYYLNDGTIPYVDVRDYVDLIDPVSRIDASDITMTEDVINVEYHPALYQYMFFVDHLEQDADEEVSLSMTIDFTNEEVTVHSYLFFLFQGMPMIDNEEDSITIEEVSIEEGNEIVIPFGEYGSDFTIQYNDTERLYLVPFHVASLLFTNSTLYRTYYNGDEIYAGGRCIYYEDIRTSSFSGTEIPEEIRQASFDLFTLSLDYFSATKQARDVSSYRKQFMRQLPTLLNVPSSNYYNELTQLLYTVDDIHADLPANGYYAKEPMNTITTYPSWFSINRSHYWDTWEAYTTAFVEQYGDFSNRPTVRLLDNQTTAVLHLYQFTTTTYEEIKSYLDSLPETVENVVLDVSVNGGGNVNAIFQVLSFMTDEPITFTNGIAINESSITYTVSMKQPAYHYNWYIKTSNLTYSAGNILALLAQDNDVATLIGEPTMGGASVIESILLPCGFTHTISGNYTFYSNEGSAEYGVPVDVPMNNLWDDEEMIDIITAPLD